MAFRDLFKAWRGEDILSKTLDVFIQMIEETHWMYQCASTSLWEKTDIQKCKTAIRARDVEVNKMERSIRKKVVQHLSIDPGADATYCLVLMSVVKDAERLGDYAKNIVEVSELYTPYKDKNVLIPQFKDIQAEVEGIHRRIGKVFRDADEQAAEEIFKTTTAVAKQCDKLLEEILKTEGLTVPQGVCYTLMARYFKRFAAHLGNIATALVMPVHKIDYFDEDDLDTEEE